jgi:hypothetical protein
MEDNIKTVRKETGCVLLECIKLAQNGIKWRTVNPNEPYGSKELG